MIFAVLVVVCSIQLPAAACQPSTAIAKAALADTAVGLGECLRRGEIAAAARGWAGRADRYVKVFCTVSSMGARAA